VSARPAFSRARRAWGRIVEPLSEEAGQVWGLIAVSLPVLVLIVGFVVDVGHWYDYRRTLQNRADAAALAGGDTYGNTCFASSPSATGLNAIGQQAANYSGVGTGSTLPAPYTYATGGPYYNVPNLTAASLDDYSVMFNSNKYASDAGATNYDMSATGSMDTSAFCKSTADGNTGPMIDVKVTQKHIPLFFKMPFSFLSHINAHARVEIQDVESERTTPIAVRDAGVTPCVYAKFIDDTSGATLTTTQNGVATQYVKLRNVDPTASPAVWANNGTGAVGPASVTMPALASGHNVSVQTFLNDCGSPPNGDLYNYDGTNHGLAYVNTFDTATPGANGAPLITTGGVKLTGGSFGGVCDPYFFVSAGGAASCTVGVTANIAFQAGLNLNTQATVTATDVTTGAPPVQLVYTGTGNTWATPPGVGLTINAGSGGHNIQISWTQTARTVTGQGTCGPGPGNPKPCTGTFGVQQRSVAGFNGENACVDPTIDTGPNAAVTIGNSATGTTAGEDAFQYGTTQSLVVTVAIAGLANAQPGDLPICLRVAVQKDHQTGIVDCGQGNGNSKDIQAIENGCPIPPGVQINTRVQPDGTSLCTPVLTPRDCVTTTQGTRNIIGGFTQPIDGGDESKCAPNNWALGNPIDVDKDPRAFVMIITAPADLSNQTGNTTVPVRGFAVFYVTGWKDNGPNGKSCTNGTAEPFPGPAGAELNGELWGHWVSVVIPSGEGTGTGQPCQTTQFGNCIPVLTR
jgi:hypothetical protein